MNEYKTCRHCHNILPVDLFHKDATRTDGRHPYCRNCHKIKHKNYYENNREKLIEYQVQYKLNNPEKKKAYQKRTKTQRSRYMKVWRQKKKQQIKDYKKQYHNMFEKTDLDYRILHNLRSRLLLALKENLKSAHTKDLIGCSIDELKTYLESKFQDGMRWDNYGRKGWHIDHVIPCASFNLSSPEEQKKCFHYSNLQPLWWIDNCRKNKF